MTAMPATAATADPRAVRVMLCDDSAVVRGLCTKWIGETPGLTLAGSAINGRLALQMAAQVKPDVIVLDIEMPELDGISALPHLLRAVPGVKILMSSTLTRRNADISLKALALGAADTVAKPEGTSVAASGDFRRELIDKIMALGQARRARLGGAATLAPAPQAAQPMPAAAARRAPGQTMPLGAIRLRAPSTVRPAVLGIGSSTGGPQALFAVLKALAPSLKLPVVLTQHMPATFTAILAEHITKMTGLTASEAKTGDVLRPRHVLVAPGDWHMLVKRTGTEASVELVQSAPENFCRPAVDPMFRSLAQVYGPATLGLVLTGMGHDGRAGGKMIVEAGGTILAQDAATSVVWGMPGAVAEAGLCAGVHPLEKLAPELIRLMEHR